VQLAIRLLIPSGSKLLELREVREELGEFDREALGYRWSNPDPRVDELQKKVEAAAQAMSTFNYRRASIFAELWRLLQQAKSADRELPILTSRAAVPYLTEPWYC
jgi:hypothetical protein